MTAPIHARKKNLQADSRDLSTLIYPTHVDGYKTLFSALYVDLKSWRRVAKPYKIYPNMARLIARGYDPGNKIRHELRLPEKQAVEVCEECGEIHFKKHPKKVTRPPRIAIRLDNPESAAASIKGHMDQAAIRELRELIKEK